MVAISFSVFKEKVKDFSKRQTIRKHSRKRFELIKRKGLLQLYWKQRSKACELLGQGRVIELFTVLFETNQVLKSDGDDWIPLSFEEMEDLAVRDGFNNFFEMYTKLYEMYGDLDNKVFMVIRWKKYLTKKQKKRLKYVRKLMSKAGMTSKEDRVKWKKEMEDW